MAPVYAQVRRAWTTNQAWLPQAGARIRVFVDRRHSLRAPGKPPAFGSRWLLADRAVPSHRHRSTRFQYTPIGRSPRAIASAPTTSPFLWSS